MSDQITGVSGEPRIALVVAQAANRVIGRQNKLPWHLSEDLRHFRRITMGKPVIMGRKTYESIGQPLSGRRNIVLSGRPDWQVPGVEVASNLAEALQIACQQPAEEIMIIGGARVYAQALPIADRVYLTQVHRELEGDAWFPELDSDCWSTVSVTSGCDEQSGVEYSFFTLDRLRRKVS